MPARDTRTGRRRCRGFTLIELLVVMAIIATLLSIALPRYFGSVDRSKEVALRQDLKTMRNAIDQFRADTGRYPKNLEELVTRRYLSEVPPDPITDSATSWVIVPPKDAKLEGVYDVRSGASGTAQDGSNFQEW
ncbi:MAG: prepilin-type N-terminal cleavage/methylation domain-containing protein [Rhodocyclaceae bacterium]|nr:prepilin-type N-terminal cleavage/methylation domain-containing protein [Rhodocyclaceae bacterium]